MNYILKIKEQNITTHTTSTKQTNPLFDLVKTYILSFPKLF